MVSRRDKLDVVDDVAWTSERSSYGSVSVPEGFCTPESDSRSIEAAMDG